MRVMPATFRSSRSRRASELVLRRHRDRRRRRPQHQLVPPAGRQPDVVERREGRRRPDVPRLRDREPVRLRRVGVPVLDHRQPATHRDGARSLRRGRDRGSARRPSQSAGVDRPRPRRRAPARRRRKSRSARMCPGGVPASRRACRCVRARRERSGDPHAASWKGAPAQTTSQTSPQRCTRPTGRRRWDGGHGGVGAHYPTSPRASAATRSRPSASACSAASAAAQPTGRGHVRTTPWPHRARAARTSGRRSFSGRAPTPRRTTWRPARDRRPWRRQREVAVHGPT